MQAKGKTYNPLHSCMLETQITVAVRAFQFCGWAVGDGGADCRGAVPAVRARLSCETHGGHWHQGSPGKVLSPTYLEHIGLFDPHEQHMDLCGLREISFLWLFVVSVLFGIYFCGKRNISVWVANWQDSANWICKAVCNISQDLFNKMYFLYFKYFNVLFCKLFVVLEK